MSYTGFQNALLKAQPDMADAHVNAPVKVKRKARSFRDAMAARVSKRADADWRIEVPIAKLDDGVGPDGEPLRVIYGLASVIHKDGAAVVDSQGDVIAERELVKAAHDFMAESRVGGVMHWAGEQGGEIVESVVLTPDVRKAMGLPAGDTGWWIGYRCTSDALWDMAQRGVFKAFSIGGSAHRVEV